MLLSKYFEPPPVKKTKSFGNFLLNLRYDPSISCKMQLVPCDRNEIEEARRSIRSRRLPLQGLRCEGSVFKNPEQGSAGKILDAAGCKGYRVGLAEVSDFHANIIVTGENAAASDVLALVQILRTKAFEASGIRLEPEIRGLTLHGKEQSRLNLELWEGATERKSFWSTSILKSARGSAQALSVLTARAKVI